MPTRSRAMSNEIRQAITEYLPDLRAFARSLASSQPEADDLVQEAVMKGWAARTSFRPGTNARAWLFTILRNVYYSQKRKAGREVEDPEGIISGNVRVPAEQTAKMELHEFRRALATLPDDQREALILIGASGFSHEEAAEIMDCAVGTVKSRVSRARKALSALFDNDDLPGSDIRGNASSALSDMIDESDNIADRDRV